jgi:hypothetical protein
VFTTVTLVWFSRFSLRVLNVSVRGFLFAARKGEVLRTDLNWEALR